MNVDAHLTKLQRNHHALEQELSTELAHPGADPYRIADIKRRKLKIKDEIARLREQTIH